MKLKQRDKIMAAKYDWETIRAEYEAGSTMGELSRKHGVNKAAISRRAKREGWLQNASVSINRLAEAKVNGLVNTVDPKKKAEAVDAAADRKAAIIKKHREAWPDIKSLNAKALAAQDFELAKLAKISAETEKIIQDGERRAWGISESADDPQKVSEALIKIDLSQASAEQISAMVDAAWPDKENN